MNDWTPELEPIDEESTVQQSVCANSIMRYMVGSYTSRDTKCFEAQKKQDISSSQYSQSSKFHQSFKKGSLTSRNSIIPQGKEMEHNL